MQQVDTLLNGLKIVQDADCFMYGIDAMLLADFASPFIYKDDSVIDLGTGNAVIPLLLSTMCRAKSITGVEIQKESFSLASQSVSLNGLEERIKIVNADMKNAPDYFGKHSFNVVVSNPPYMLNSQGKLNPNDAKAIARHEVCCTLDDVVCAADYLLSTHGKFFMIHRPSRLAEIFTALAKYKLEPKRMCMIHPSKDKNANMVLIEARKNAAPELKVEPPVFVYKEKQIYSEQIDLITARVSNNIQHTL